MAFDFEMIKSLYAKIENSVISAKKILNRPLTSSEKYCILIFGILS